MQSYLILGRQRSPFLFICIAGCFFPLCRTQTTSSLRSENVCVLQGGMSIFYSKKLHFYLESISNHENNYADCGKNSFQSFIYIIYNMCRIYNIKYVYGSLYRDVPQKQRRFLLRNRLCFWGRMLPMSDHHRKLVFLLLFSSAGKIRLCVE